MTAPPHPPWPVPPPRPLHRCSPWRRVQAPAAERPPEPPDVVSPGTLLRAPALVPGVPDWQARCLLPAATRLLQAAAHLARRWCPLRSGPTQGLATLILGYLRSPRATAALAVGRRCSGARRSTPPAPAFAAPPSLFAAKVYESVYVNAHVYSNNHVHETVSVDVNDSVNVYSHLHA